MHQVLGDKIRKSTLEFKHKRANIPRKNNCAQTGRKEAWKGKFTTTKANSSSSSFLTTGISTELRQLSITNQCGLHQFSKERNRGGSATVVMCMDQYESKSL